MIRGVAFDFDGTLVDSNRIKHETFFAVVADAGGDARVMGAILDGPHGDRFDIFRRFVAELPLAGVTAQHLSAEYSRRVEDAIATTPETAGAGALLAALSQRPVHLAVISATPAVALGAVVARRGWRQLFDAIIGDAADKAQALRQFADYANLEPHEILMLGDHEVDRRGAAEFGCAFFGVRRPDSDFAELPAVVVSDLNEAARLIEPLTSPAR